MLPKLSPKNDLLKFKLLICWDVNFGRKRKVSMIEKEMQYRKDVPGMVPT